MRSSVNPSGDAPHRIAATLIAACRATVNLPDGDVVLFLTATSGIVADLEMRGEGTLGGIWAWIDTIRPAGQALSRNLFLRSVLAPSSVPLLCLEFVT